MDKIRFQIARSVDRCFETQLAIRDCCCNCKNKLSRSRHRPLYFAHTKVTTSTLIILYFAIEHQGGIRRSTSFESRIGFFSVLFTEWTGAVMLVFAYKRRNATLNLIWCFLQACSILLLLLLTLSELVKIFWPGLIILGLDTLIKLHGLWLIYYFYLQLKNSPDMHASRSRNKLDKDPFDIKYFNEHSRKESQGGEDVVGKRGRKNTERTSIFSSAETLSPPADILEHRRSTFDSIVSEEAPFKLHFFPSTQNDSERSSSIDPESVKTLKYAEVEVICENKTEKNSITEELGNLQSYPKTEIDGSLGTANETDGELQILNDSSAIFSNLMCGGTASINVEN